MSEIIEIQCVLTLNSPLHVADPASHYASVDSRYPVAASKAPQGFFPCTATQKMRIHSRDQDSLHKPTQVPFIPANSIRGRLRRCAASIIFDVLRDRGEQLSIGAYHGMSCGAVTGQPAKGLPFSYIQQARQHPFLGVFGGGPRLVPSAMTLGTAFPVVEETIQIGLVPDTLQSYSCGTSNNITDVFFARRIDDVTVFRGRFSDEQIIKDGANEILKWAELTSSIKDVDDDGNTTASRNPLKLDSWSAYEVVLPGVTFSFSLELNIDHVGTAGYGLLLLSLQNFVRGRGKYLGGLQRHQFGGYNAEWKDSTGNIVMDAQGNLNMALPHVVEALSDFESAKASITAAEIEALYQLDE
jgi:CRISPR type IV-associated protein Csf2